MEATLIVGSHADIEQGIPRRCSATASNSDKEKPQCSTECRSSDSCIKEAVGMAVINDKERKSSSSSSSSCVSAAEVVDLENAGGGGAVVETKVSVHLPKVERDCRICHLSLDGSNPESGYPIELGCSCKDDLAAAHKHCAEAWFKIRGNKICEICGSTARNVVEMNDVESMEQWNEPNEAATPATRSNPPETRHFWQGHRFLNFLLACMVFAFVISWLFHFNVPS